MDKQLYWEDVEVGSEIIPLSKVASTQTLVKWAGACGDFFPLHFDSSFVATRWPGKIVIHGPLKRAWMIQMLTDWMGEKGTLKKISCQYRLLDYPRPMKTYFEPEEGETWWCKGKVTKKYVEDGEHYIDCDIRVENGKGEVTTPGKAIVALPSRG